MPTSTIEGKEALTAAKELAYEKVRKTSKKLDHIRKLFHDLENRYYKEKSAFEKLDRDLAMIDGRYHKVKHTPKTKTTIALLTDLSQAQILAIAKTLGETLEGGDSNG